MMMMMMMIACDQWMGRIAIRYFVCSHLRHAGNFGWAHKRIS